ncbi:uncharacterized protein [Oscarella lobularis]|uniref:uncharacterized protein isoform X2 n=1 Tax=Oscarella lobularis TaxID=121494 RepID=UPI0033137CD5
MWKELLLRHFDALRNALAEESSLHILDQLLKETLITQSEFDELRERSFMDRAARLLQEILPAKGDRAYDRFRILLQKSEKLAWIAKRYMPPRKPEKLPAAQAESKLFPASDFHYDDEKDYIGSGGSAEIFRAMMAHSGRIVAAKVFLQGQRLPDKDFRQFEREAKILSSFKDDHPNIVRLVGVCTEQKRGILLLEFVEGGDLHSLLHDDPQNRDVESWRVRLSMALDIATGMDYLYSLSPPVHHLDLKPKNILVNKGIPGEYQCKITDFGLALTHRVTTRHAQSRRKSAAGTTLYMAPERLNEDGFDLIEIVTNHPEKAVKLDVYSFGIILYELRERKEPSSDLDDVVRYRIKENILLPASSHNDSYDSLLRRCAGKSFFKRPTFGEALIELQGIFSTIVTSVEADKEESRKFELGDVSRSTAPYLQHSKRMPLRVSSTPDHVSTFNRAETARAAAVVKSRSLPPLSGYSENEMKSFFRWSSGPHDPTSSAESENSDGLVFEVEEDSFAEGITSAARFCGADDVHTSLSFEEETSGYHPSAEKRFPAPCLAKSEPSTPTCAASGQRNLRRLSVPLESSFDADAIASHSSNSSLLQSSLPSIEERSEISFPLLSDLPKMRWGELSQVCQTHGFSSEPGFHDVKDESSLRKFVEECIMKRQVSSCCPLDKIASKVETCILHIGKKRSDFVALMKEAKQSAMNNYDLQEIENEAIEDFDQLVKDVTEQIPTVMILGCGSAGVTTTLNCLLGEEILSRDVGSSAPACEIVYGEEKRFKVVVNVEGREVVKKDKSLQDGDAVDVLRQCLKDISGGGGHQSSRAARRQRDPNEYKVIIFWPSFTLKHIRLVDAPNPLGYVAVEPSVSGFIFVLDTSPSKDVIEQAKRLYDSVSATFDTFPIAVLFVLNKWDQFKLSCSALEKQEQFLETVFEGIAALGPAFQKENFVTFSAIEACFNLQCRREMTKELSCLCEAKSNIVPRWIEVFLLRKLSDVFHHLAHAKRSQENQVKKLEFERKGNWSVKKFPLEVKKEIEELASALVKSNILMKECDWNSKTDLEQTAADEKNLDALMRLRLCRTIINSAEFDSFHQWLASKALWASQFNEIYLMQTLSLNNSHVGQAASVVFKDVSGKNLKTLIVS